MKLLENVRVFGQGFAINGRGMLSTDRMAHATTPQFMAHVMKGYADIETRPHADIREAEQILLWGNDNFGHWLFTYLHRLFHAETHYNAPLAVPDFLPKRFLEWLPLLGFNQPIIPAPDNTLFRSLLVSPVMHYRDARGGIHSSPDALKWFRNRLVKSWEGPHTRIYLTRENARWRKLINEDDLIHALERKGFLIVEPEYLSAQTQIDVISNAGTIVTVLGGGSPLTMLAPVTARIIEIAPPNISGEFGSKLWANMLGQEHIRVNADATQTNTGPLPTDYDITVNVAKVIHAINRG